MWYLLYFNTNKNANNSLSLVLSFRESRLLWIFSLGEGGFTPPSFRWWLSPSLFRVMECFLSLHAVNQWRLGLSQLLGLWSFVPFGRVGGDWSSPSPLRAMVVYVYCFFLFFYFVQVGERLIWFVLSTKCMAGLSPTFIFLMPDLRMSVEFWETRANFRRRQSLPPTGVEFFLFVCVFPFVSPVTVCFVLFKFYWNIYRLVARSALFSF